MRLWLALACLLWASPVWAQPAPLPDYDTCTIVWTFLEFRLYEQRTPTGPAVQAGRQGPFGPDDTTIKTWTFPCPVVKGTYYYSLTMVDVNGREGPRTGGSVGFTIKGGDPALVLAIGGTAQVKALDRLNVRATPGGAIVGTQKNGATATILAGPIGVLAPPQFAGYWWQLDFGTVRGWCLELFLVPVPPAAPAMAIMAPNPNAHK